MPGTTAGAEPTRLAVHPGATRVRVDLVTGALAPRLIERDASSAQVALAAAQMLLLDGDTVHIEIEVGAACTLEIDDVGGTVAYPGRSSWQVRARIGAGARLIWKGLPFVVTAEAHARRHTELLLGPDAAVLVRETLVLGRHGEYGGGIDSEITARSDAGPILVERLTAEARSPGPGVLGDQRVLDSVLALGYRPPTEPGDLVLEQPGAVARYLGRETHASGLDAVWRSWRAALESEPSPQQAAPATTASVTALIE